ncbi:MAG: hypothetical protein P4L81_00230 [Candidatus Pacebacteria bacterium]|nr:hypothetical protein [Candidatus Paceibacterota bacterium]
MAAHADRSLVRARFDFLAELLAIGYVKSVERDGGVGSILDVHALECRTLADGVKGVENIRPEVRRKLFAVTTGRELVAPLLENLDVFCEVANKEVPKSRKIESISRSTVGEQLRDKKLSDLIENGAIKSYDERVRDVFRMQHELGEYLLAHGDEKLLDPRAIATEFYSPLRAMTGRKFSSVREFVEWSFGEEGIPLAERDFDMTVGEYCERAQFRRKMETVCASGLVSKRELDAIKPEELPSYCLYQTFRRHSHVPDRHEGGSLHDALIVATSVYADCVVVDKRTYDNLRVTEQKMKQFHTFIRSYVRVKTYRDLPGKLCGL